MSLRADITLQRGDFRLEAAFSCPSGETVALVGPNGAGKSSILAALAGTIPIDRGEIIVDSRVLERSATRTRLPPQERAVGVLFQGLALFSHLNVLENIAFGLRARGLEKTPAHALAREWMHKFDVNDLETRRVDSLSGGQAQRVALARALAIEPRLLLLDEPLSSLDALHWRSSRELLRQTFASFDGVSLIVTHDIRDAVDLADHIVVIEEGKLVQQGTGREIQDRPATPHLQAMLDRAGYRQAHE